MKNTYRVLVVEDEKNYSELISRALSRHDDGINFELVVATTFAEAIEGIGKHKVDMILLDLILPDNAGIDIIENFNQINPDVPIVVLTGLENDELAIEAIHKGAADFILKKDFTRSSLPRVIKYAVEREYAYERLRQNKEKLRNLFAGPKTSIYRCRFDRQWTMIFLSDSILNITGYSPKDFVDNHVVKFSSIIHPDDTIMVEQEISSQILDSGSYEVVYRILDVNGDVRWILDSGNAEKFENHISNLNGVLVDITDLKSEDLSVGFQKSSFNSFEHVDRIAEDLNNIIKLVKQTNLSIIRNQNTIVDSDKLKSNLFVADNILCNLTKLIEK